GPVHPRRRRSVRLHPRAADQRQWLERGARRHPRGGRPVHDFPHRPRLGGQWQCQPAGEPGRRTRGQRRHDQPQRRRRRPHHHDRLARAPGRVRGRCPAGDPRRRQGRARRGGRREPRRGSGQHAPPAAGLPGRRTDHLHRRHDVPVHPERRPPMSNRISTSMMFDTSLATMLARQKQLAQLQQQVATGKKIVTAKDDPVGAGAAVGLDRSLAELERFALNANNVNNRLGMQENVLALAGDDMIRINELAVQANSDTLSDDDRRSIAAELRSLREHLVSLANSSDGSGRYLFAGAADDVAPFGHVAGGVAYNGDQTQRTVEIAPDTFVKDTLPGSEVFMRIRTGVGTVDARMYPVTTGYLVLEGFSRSAAGGCDGSGYRIEFTTGNGYSVTNGNGNPDASGTWEPKQDIEFGGLRLRVSGT